MFRGDHLGGGGDKDRGHGEEGSASASEALSPQVEDAIELFVNTFKTNTSYFCIVSGSLSSAELAKG
jgi:hypothetical protein